MTHDFSLTYVADNNSRSTPLLYSITGMWSALAGSILLWGVILGGYTTAMVWRFRRAGRRPAGRPGPPSSCTWCPPSSSVSCSARPTPSPTWPGRCRPTGSGPNVLLQDNPLVLFHPPMLYLGLVGFTLPFAFAVASLVTGPARRGLAGGDPALDPVRLDVPHRRDRARRLVVLPGAGLGWVLGVGPGGERLAAALAGRHRLPPLGHGPAAPRPAPGVEPVAGRSPPSASPSSAPSSPARVSSSRCTPSPTSTIGPLLLGFFGAGAGRRGRTDRLAGRPAASPGGIDSAISREGAFLANNLLFVLFAFVVLLGTVFPLLYEALNSGAQVAVGAPYFNRMVDPARSGPPLPDGGGPGAARGGRPSAEVMRGRLAVPAAIGVVVVVAACSAASTASSRCSPSGSGPSPRRRPAGHWCSRSGVRGAPLGPRGSRRPGPRWPGGGDWWAGPTGA